MARMSPINSCTAAGQLVKAGQLVTLNHSLMTVMCNKYTCMSHSTVSDLWAWIFSHV